ncbi:hypothetical protein TWF281_004246 [Arthrobotrys megalospora]
MLKAVAVNKISHITLLILISNLAVPAPVVPDGASTISITGDRKEVAVGLEKISVHPANLSMTTTIDITPPKTNATAAFNATIPGGIRPEAPDAEVVRFRESNDTNKDLIPTKTASDKRVDTVSPSWFYRQHKMSVVCTHPERMLERIVQLLLDPTNSQGLTWPITMEGVTFDDLPNIAQLEPEEALAVIQRKQSSCELCKCDPDVGAIIPDRWAVRDPSKGVWCNSQHKANLCADIYGCYCDAELMSPRPTSITLTQEDYQRAWDEIPGHIKDRDPTYTWEWGANRAKTRPPMRIDTSRNRVVVHDPGFKEPFLLSGPDQKTDVDYFDDVWRQSGFPFGIGGPRGVSSGSGLGGWK